MTQDEETEHTYIGLKVATLCGPPGEYTDCFEGGTGWKPKWRYKRGTETGGLTGINVKMQAHMCKNIPGTTDLQFLPWPVKGYYCS